MNMKGVTLMMVAAQLLIICGLIIAGFTPLVLYLCKGKTYKVKMILWGITTMIIFAPILSWSLAISIAVIVKDGFAAVALIALFFPTIFITGLVILLVGLFKKKKPQQLA
ncbi:hypothetical protein MHI18_01770 [Peribacillus sp. FSL H8-0477]|uniref:hypothetical protein n=1 Tax=Peribacillus sp. FSL H8-0477 TaxID=2921388 RepID=UPI0030FA523F